MTVVKLSVCLSICQYVNMSITICIYYNSNIEGNIIMTVIKLSVCLSICIVYIVYLFRTAKNDILEDGDYQ